MKTKRRWGGWRKNSGRKALPYLTAQQVDLLAQVITEVKQVTLFPEQQARLAELAENLQEIKTAMQPGDTLKVTRPTAKQRAEFDAVFPKF